MQLRRITAKYNGRCKECRTAINQGAAMYYGGKGYSYCAGCGSIKVINQEDRMPRTKSRTVVKVETNDYGDKVVTVEIGNGFSERCTISELSRDELIATAMLVMPGRSSSYWRNTFPNDYWGNLRLREVIKGEDPIPDLPAPTPINPDLERLLNEEEIERRQREAQPARHNGMEAIVAEIAREVAEQVRQSTLDRDQVETIVNDQIGAIGGDVDEKINAAVARLAPKVTVVNLPDREPITVEGTQHKMFATVLHLVQRRKHVWLVGPAGTGKSFMAEQVAEVLGLEFASLSLSSQTPNSEIFGYSDATGTYRRSLFRNIYENGGVFLFDEMDNGNPNTLAKLNQSLANGHCAFPDAMVRKHKDTVVIAAANTYGTGATKQYVGRNQIDKATLNRFFKVTIDIDLDLEEQLVMSVAPTHGATWLAYVRRCRANVEQHNLQVIVSPRDALEGAEMIEDGMDQDEVAEMRFLAGLTNDERYKVTA